MLNFYKRLL